MLPSENHRDCSLTLDVCKSLSEISPTPTLADSEDLFQQNVMMTGIVG